MGDYAWTCPYCGWRLTWSGLAGNDGFPYCCRDAEKNLNEGGERK